MRWKAASEVYDMLKKLARVPSVSGTKQEIQMAETIAGALWEIPYFQEHKEYVKLHSIVGDPLSRQVVTALFKGPKNAKKTVVLLSHFDVVGVEGFGRLAQYAFEPEQLTEILRQEFADTLDEDARKDLESGDWLFGRGVMDMKAGLAMQMSVLRHFSESADFDGNLLLLATPDEETSSAGMMQAVTVLNELKAEHDLTYELCICSEANWSAYPGDDARYMYTGSVGKLLPVICAVGVETHVGEPLLGLNAGWMIGEIVCRLELARELVDTFDGESGPPPTCLDMSVIKEAYNAQTPNFAYAMFNVLTLGRSPDELLGIVKELAKEAASTVYERIAARHAAVESGGDQTARGEKSRPKVFYYNELRQLGAARFGEPFVAGMDQILREAEATSADPRKVSVRLAQYVSGYFIEEAPFYVLLVAPPYYPHVYLRDDVTRDKALQEIANRLHKEALLEDERMQMRRFFPGLSDVSYCRLDDADQVLATLKKHMPVLDRLYHLPIAEITKLDVPTLDIGPFGKDAHKWTERLHIPYSTEVAPALLARAIRYTLQGVSTERA